MTDGIYQCRACYFIITDEVPMLCDQCLACSWVFVNKHMDPRHTSRLVMRYPADMKLFVINTLIKRAYERARTATAGQA